MSPTRLAVAIVLCVAFSGCGSSDGPQADKPTIRNNPGPDKWTEAQVVEAAGLTTEDGGLSYETKSGCSVAVVMTNARTVEVYAGAGDTVVTNPDGTAGLKTGGSDQKCLAELQRGMATLKP